MMNIYLLIDFFFWRLFNDADPCLKLMAGIENKVVSEVSCVQQLVLTLYFLTGLKV